MLPEFIDLPQDQLPGRVLLVEDDAIIAINAEMMLDQIGIEHVHSAVSVAEAMALIDEMQFDFAMLDFSLGDENSAAIVRRLRAADVPVLITTGYLEVDLPDGCADVAILVKPYRLADLQRMLLATWR